MARKLWSHDEMVLALALYFQLPFGRINYTIMTSPSLKDKLTKNVFQDHFGRIENRKIILPEEHQPDVLFLQHHIENVFIA